MLVRRVIERDAAGEVISFVGVTLDVIARVEQSRRVEQLAHRLEAAANAARIGIWSSVIGSRQTEWNAQMYALFDRAGGGEPPTLGHWIRQCVHPDDAMQMTHAIYAFLRRESEAFEIEFRPRKRDGRVRWMVLRANLDRSNPETARVFSIAMDVTERHEAVDALHTASERAALIARHAGIGTWETDDHGRPALWDAQMWQLRGLAPRPVALNREERLALVHPDDLGVVVDAFAGRHGNNGPSEYEFRVRWPDGSYRWLASRSAALQDIDGTMHRRVGVNWDITETRHAELARQQALLTERESQAKSQFLARMSHELRTPLNAILGFTQLLQFDFGHGGAQAQLAKSEHIRTAGEHLLTLIDDTLDLSSLQSGTLRLEPRVIQIAVAVAQALPLVHGLAATHGVSLHSGALAGSVHADPTRLRQVLLNLLTSAIKYNRRGGQVVIEAAASASATGATSERAGAESMRLSVRDTGRGMRPDQLAHLFEPFNRLGMESAGVEGSGIGLTIARAVVEGMGGQIVVSSEPGVGTRVEVTLPVRPTPAPVPLGVADTRPPATAPTRSGQLLYIEDNSVNVLLVEELVKSLSGLRIVSEATDAGGVARARSMRPDLILIDMQLPDLDGFEVLKRLRALPETAAIRCIALSANAMSDDIERALAAGFDDYWTKPIAFEPFIAALERLFPASAAAH